MEPPNAINPISPRRSPRLNKNIGSQNVELLRINAKAPKSLNKSKTVTPQDEMAEAMQEDKKPVSSIQSSIADRLNSGHCLVLEAKRNEDGIGAFGYCESSKCPMYTDHNDRHPILSLYRLKLCQTPLSGTGLGQRYEGIARCRPRPSRSIKLTGP